LERRSPEPPAHVFEATGPSAPFAELAQRFLGPVVTEVGRAAL
jgi:hypothetical protein